MEPFSIACTTCQARLRVRDESVIGQILTCPKCGSMVLVEPLPAEPLETQPAAPATEPIGETAAPASDFSDAASLFEQPAPHDLSEQTAKTRQPAPHDLSVEKAKRTQPASKEPSEFADTVEDISVQGEARSAPASEPPPRGFTDAEDESHPAQDAWSDPDSATEDHSPAHDSAVEYDSAAIPEQPLLPNADWTSPTATAWRNRALTGIAVVVGVVLALTAFLLFNGSSDPQPPVPPLPLETAQLDPLAAEPMTVEDTSDPEQDTAGDHAAAEEAAALPNAPAQVESPAEAPDETSVQPEAVAVGPDLQDGAVTEPAGDEITEQANNTDAATPPPVALPDEDPPESPPGLTTAEEPKTGSGASGSVADTLRDFGELLGSPDTAASDMAEAEADPEITPDADAPAEDEALPRPGARVVDVDARLRDPIAAIDFKRIPLVKFLRFVSDYSTIPVTLDADSLVWCKITPSTLITVTATDSTVSDVLTEAIRPLGLYYRIEREQLFVTRRPKNESGLRTATFKVSDLVGDDAQELQRLGEMIMDLVEPDSWTRRGGNGSLSYEGMKVVMEQEEPILFEVLAFCQKMRVLSGLDVGGQYAPSIFRLETRTARAQRKLDQPISLTYIRPASFQRIVDRISETARIHVLIDWRTLAEVDWSPDAEVAFATAGEPLSDALTKLLEPMDLTYRVVSESVLQITTQEAFDARLEVEFYPIGILLAESGEVELIQAIHSTLGNNHFRKFGGDSLLTVDPTRKCLLACMPQSQQVRLEKWLAEQTAAVAAAGAVKAGPVNVGATIPTAAGEFRIAPVSDPGSND